MAIDPNNFASTGDFDGFLTPEQSAPIFEEMSRRSLVQALGRRVEMGPTGVSIPYWDGEVTASWVDEAGQKPLTKGGFSKFTMQPKKIATIFTMSAEVVRANPLNYLNVMREKVAEAFAIAFDNAALHGLNSPFSTYVDQTTKSVEFSDALGATNTALSLLVNDDRKFTGGLLDFRTEPIINSAKDANGRPLFIEPTYLETNSVNRQGRILSRPVMIAEGVRGAEGNPLGYYGDFSQLLWGQIGGITYDVSDQASIDLSAAQDGSGITSLWQNNLLAVRCEAEFAIHVRDPQSFVKLTAAGSGSSPIVVTGGTTANAPTITTDSPLPSRAHTTAYAYNFSATGGTAPYTWSVDEAAPLPAGLTLAGDTGRLEGTAAAGTHNFTVKVTDSAGAVGSKAFTLVLT